jgi:hypothetical protein
MRALEWRKGKKGDLSYARNMEDVLVVAGQLEDVSTLVQRLRADGTLVVVFLICVRQTHHRIYDVSCKFAAKTSDTGGCG